MVHIMHKYKPKETERERYCMLNEKESMLWIVKYIRHWILRIMYRVFECDDAKKRANIDQRR